AGLDVEGKFELLVETDAIGGVDDTPDGGRRRGGAFRGTDRRDHAEKDRSGDDAHEKRAPRHLATHLFSPERAGGGAVDPRTTRETGTTIRAASSGAIRYSTRAARRRTASRPSCRLRTCTVVRPGVTCCAWLKSSKPAMESSP